MAVDLSSQALSVEALASKGASGVFGSDAAAPWKDNEDLVV